MNKPANCCGCTHTHTHTHTCILTEEKLAKIASVCLSYSKIENKKVCNIQKKYKYMKIGVV